MLDYIILLHAGRELKQPQPLLGNKSSACLGGKGPQYYPSVSQDQKDSGIKYVFYTLLRLLVKVSHRNSLSNSECKYNLFAVRQLLQPVISTSIRSDLLFNAPGAVNYFFFLHNNNGHISFPEMPSDQLQHFKEAAEQTGNSFCPTLHAWLDYD